MASTSETGHAINAANLKKLITQCTAYGTRYNPTNNLIKILNMQTLLTNTNTALSAVNTAKAPFTLATNTRATLFQEAEKLAGRAKNALDATELVSDETVQDAMTILRKIRGARKSKKIINPPSPDAPTPATTKQISASQQSFNQQVEHFNQLITLLAAVPNYLPNEVELQPTQLPIFENQLRNANNAVINTTTPYTNALQNRNNLMYTKTTGLIDIALEAKKYVKSVKTINPAEFRKISGLTFRRPTKK